MIRRGTVLVVAALLALILAAPAALAGGATQISGSAFSTNAMPATPRAWAPTSPSS